MNQLNSKAFTLNSVPQISVSKNAKDISLNNILLNLYWHLRNKIIILSKLIQDLEKIYKILLILSKFNIKSFFFVLTNYLLDS